MSIHSWSVSECDVKLLFTPLPGFQKCLFRLLCQQLGSLECEVGGVDQIGGGAACGEGEGSHWEYADRENLKDFLGS